MNTRFKRSTLSLSVGTACIAISAHALAQQSGGATSEAGDKTEKTLQTVTVNGAGKIQLQ